MSTYDPCTSYNLTLAKLWLASRIPNNMYVFFIPNTNWFNQAYQLAEVLLFLSPRSAVANMGIELAAKIATLQTHMDDFINKPANPSEPTDLNIKPLEQDLKEIIKLQGMANDEKMPTSKFESDLLTFIADPAKWQPLQNKFARDHVKTEGVKNSAQLAARSKEAKLAFKMEWAKLRLENIKKSKVHSQTYRKVNRNLATRRYVLLLCMSRLEI